MTSRAGRCDLRLICRKGDKMIQWSIQLNMFKTSHVLCTFERVPYLWNLGFEYA